ncbi:succinate dehydrogenase, hydrophobic membrane anchor protein [Jhaorihella thermophila]|uniref:Succinate dehydrogenase hydrophobic membrane anchor subunit n=1 Tax=Jhaorihella thermophila TaxID=488547 RepID=A0A1H5SM91_9RHOB|nr:succinate dehydrogenase, hydrophobic membrane anchor protein [Jhaorihella thermophila]SEF51733.1 succinate dehydrogenase / fumarate reductase membrane anchor subunit [Jhaorihella thermophila]
MRYLTDRKRAEGHGAAHSGTGHHWYMQVSAFGLALIVPTFIVIFGRALGSGYENVIETFSHPIPAIVTGLVLLVGMQHFRRGAQVMIEDYTRKSTRKVLIMCVIVLSYGLTATGLYALGKIALGH